MSLQFGNTRLFTTSESFSDHNVWNNPFIFLKRWEEEEEEERKRYEAFAKRMELMREIHSDSSTTSRSSNKRKRSRSKKRNVIHYLDENNKRVELSPRTTFWYVFYVMNGDNMSPQELKKFRRRFRLPHAQFKELLKDMNESPKFSRWKDGKSDCTGQRSSPLSLLLLGSLRYLGRGWCFDDCEEQTCINEETHRQFFHKFIDYGSSEFFHKHVITPQTAEQAKTHIREMALAGFPGCVSSTDGTHISMDKCAYRFRQLHIGFKLCFPSRAYNLSANHRRQIMFSTEGHPASWNDKTLQNFDTFMCDIHSGKSLADVEFELYDKNERGEIIKVHYKGAWQLVDNGYLPWSTAIPPMKLPITAAEDRWSRWAESMRKDVECTFGILKGRWRILKSPILVHSIQAVDKIWKTCCGLHNWLLKIDGMDQEWDGGSGIPSEWEGDLGAPLQMQRLHYEMRDLNREERIDEHDNTIHAESGTGVIDPNGINFVRKLTRTAFQAALVRHLTIAWEKNELIWPQRNTERNNSH